MKGGINAEKDVFSLLGGFHGVRASLGGMMCRIWCEEEEPAEGVTN